MTNEECQSLADLLSKQMANVALTDQERALLGELLAKNRNLFSPEQDEKVRRAACLRAGTALGTLSRAKLRGCGLTEDQIDLYDDVRGRLHRIEKSGSDEKVAPEEQHTFEVVRRLVERCWSGGGGGDPPQSDSGPDDSGPSITDTLGVQHGEDDNDETEPTSALPVQEPAPVQVLLAVKPEDKKKKAKLRTQAPGRKGGVDFP